MRRAYVWENNHAIRCPACDAFISLMESDVGAHDFANYSINCDACGVTVRTATVLLLVASVDQESADARAARIRAQSGVRDPDPTATTLATQHVARVRSGAR